MKIIDINLDDFDKKEFLAFLETLTNYYYVLFDESLIIKKRENNE